MILTDSAGGSRTTLEYKRANSPGSDGELDLTQISINQGTCKIGEWKIVFTDNSGNYKISAPDGQEYTANTAADPALFPSPVYEISIPAAAWSDNISRNFYYY